jgi:hypothetical protein
LLDRGTGGVPEVRNAIDNYEETSPLYGFLQYRRRKVILRYMPEGLSRLIQGMPSVLRVAYHRDPAVDQGPQLPQLEATFNSNPCSTSLPRMIPYSP